MRLCLIYLSPHFLLLPPTPRDITALYANRKIILFQLFFQAETFPGHFNVFDFVVNWVALKRAISRALIKLLSRLIGLLIARINMLIEMLLMWCLLTGGVVFNFHSKDDINWKAKSFRGNALSEASHSTLINQPNVRGLLSTWHNWKLMRNL